MCKCTTFWSVCVTELYRCLPKDSSPWLPINTDLGTAVRDFGDVGN